MVPLVALAGELAAAIASIHAAADAVEAETGVRVPYLVGTMVETPRAALIAGELAGMAQFLSFGTNDLTQLTYGFSRDDVEAQLLTAYMEQDLLPVSPFAAARPARRRGADRNGRRRCPRQSIRPSSSASAVSTAVTPTRSSSVTSSGLTTCPARRRACLALGWPRPTQQSRSAAVGIG